MCVLKLNYILKYWQEYYLVKCIEKHFGKINIGDTDLDEMLLLLEDQILCQSPKFSSLIFHLIRYGKILEW